MHFEGDGRKPENQRHHMPRFHFGVILLAEVRTGVGKRVEGEDPVGTIAALPVVGRGGPP